MFQGGKKGRQRRKWIFLRCWFKGQRRTPYFTCVLLLISYPPTPLGIFSPTWTSLVFFFFYSLSLYFFPSWIYIFFFHPRLLVDAYGLWLLTVRWVMHGTCIKQDNDSTERNLLAPSSILFFFYLPLYSSFQSWASIYWKKHSSAFLLFLSRFCLLSISSSFFFLFSFRSILQYNVYTLIYFIWNKEIKKMNRDSFLRVSGRLKFEINPLQFFKNKAISCTSYGFLCT